jgi:hypothetical protein
VDWSTLVLLFAGFAAIVLGAAIRRHPGFGLPSFPSQEVNGEPPWRSGIRWERRVNGLLLIALGLILIAFGLYDVLVG